jgi:hypothetical protein
MPVTRDQQFSTPEPGRQPISWVDRLLTWIEGLPGPPWAYYLASTLLFVVLGHTLRWQDGSLPAGTFDPYRFVNDSTTVYALALLQYLRGVARDSLSTFRPALGALESDYQILDRKLTTMSPRSALVAAVAGLLLTLLSFRADPEAWGFTATTSFVTSAVTFVQGCLSTVPFFVMIVRVVQQLRLITEIHRSSSGISLYERETHHAFSRLTVRASIGLVLPIYYYSFITYLSQGRLGTMSAVDTGLVAFAFLISAAAFVLPLNGMHRRLVREKSRLRNESDRRFEATARRIHQLVDSNAYGEMGGLNTALSALTAEKESLKKISTWPWEAETFRSFLSSIGLPVLLWLITRFLGRYFS